MSFDLHIEKQLGECRIDLSITSDAQIVALTGPSGAGKSSILNCIAGLLRPDRGHITIGKRTLFDAEHAIDCPPETRGCGYVFQDNRLFPHLNAQRNLVYGHARATGSSRFTLDTVADLLDIAPLLRRKPDTLSGGEQRRLAIGRALLSGPDFLILDEPLTSLDAGRGDTILTIFEQLRDETDIPILYVSHDKAEVDRVTSTVFSVD